MARDFFDGLGLSLSKTAQSFSGKVGDVYEARKLKSRISAEKRMAEKLMTDIGRILYKKFADGEEISDDLVSLCNEIKGHEDTIDELKADAAGKKGRKICPACKKEVENEASFCPYCGSRVPESISRKTDEFNEFFEEEGDELSGESGSGIIPETAEAVTEMAEAVMETAEAVSETAADTDEDAAAETVGDVFETAAERAGDVFEAAAETAGDIFETAAETAGDVFEAAEETAGDVSEAVSETDDMARETMDAAGDAVKETVEAVSETVSETADIVKSVSETVVIAED